MAKTKAAVLAGHVNRAAEDIRAQAKKEAAEDPYLEVLSLAEAKAKARTCIEPISENGAMDPKFKEKWLKALRSGRFKQARGHLKAKVDRGWGHCCLGVLSETDPKVQPSYEGHFDVKFAFPMSGVVPEWEKYHIRETQEDGAMVPAEFAEARYGLQDDVLDQFAGLNDSGATFETIAGLIEEYL